MAAYRSVLYKQRTRLSCARHSQFQKDPPQPLSQDSGVTVEVCLRAENAGERERGREKQSKRIKGTPSFRY